MLLYLLFFFFFFQAEDGIRDLTVTGVQTCALPICLCQSNKPKHRCNVTDIPPAYSYPCPDSPGRRRQHNESFHEVRPRRDRKSTRLNSSHSQISYAVFCLKKKKKITYPSNLPSTDL